VIWCLCVATALLLGEHWNLYLSPIPLIAAAAVTFLHAAIHQGQLNQSRASDKAFTDAPIGTWTNDKLHRKAFVDALQVEITQRRSPVISITAPYGDGKTSVLNLLESQLTQDKSIRVVRFSSWLPGNEESLAATFFNSIVRTLEKDFILGPARFKFVKYARRIASILPAQANRLAQSWFHEPAQSEQISELKRVISDFPVRVVVLIDDVDRMNLEELQALLKLVRGISDFENMTFICSFHPDALTTLLRARMGGRLQAAEFLEKFFPIQFPLPPADVDALGREFDRRFETLCK
jgi:predicted KAP-like P-loop ATPase